MLSNLFRPRIDRILFAATKADHLHHSRAMTGSKRCCGARSPGPPARPKLRALRSTSSRCPRCAPPARPSVTRGRDKLPSITGTPAPGEIANGETFDGETEVATFPGDLPDNPEELFNGGFRGLSSAPSEKADFRFLRFRPPLLEHGAGDEPTLPHIRLDRALQFLIGDRLQ